MDKKDLMEMLQKDPSKYWKVKLFDNGWERRQCPSCTKFFWTIDADRELCGDSSCEEYSFIGNKRKDWDYIETWKQVEKFFKDNGHASVPRYPVLCRWRPDLFFTVASIIDFQRIGKNGVEFNLPHNPLVVPQVSLRFNDLPNVGVTGRHNSSFIMIGQHSMPPEGYWKDECVELDFKLLTEVFGISPKEITFIEDVWAGGGAGGYSLEYFAGGLELGNAVFTEFKASESGWNQMDSPVIDMGAGLERFAWFLSGKTSVYDAAFGPVMENMAVEYDKDLFERYSRIAGKLDFEDNLNLKRMKAEIAKELGVTEEDLKKGIEKKQASYVVADHAKTLLYALNDGAIPSNTSYGYNLRLVLRRALSLIDEHGLPFKLIDVMQWHQDYLKNMDNTLTIDERIREIISYEDRKYRETKDNVAKRISSIVSSGAKIDENMLIQLYDSEGIQPELIEDEARKRGIEISIPSDFYSKITERHMSRDIEKEKGPEDDGLQATENLWHSDIFEFDAKVLKSNGNWVVLDRTAFYPESGGQENDKGTINGIDVIEVHKHGDVVHHLLKEPLKDKEAHGIVDKERRTQLMAHHDATHIIHGICHKMLGDHVWQNSAYKDVEKARIDITHYKSLTDKELAEIEKEANRIVKEDRKITKTVMPRMEAESKYGFFLYQGGVPTSDDIRVVDIDGVDIEGCGGSHGDSTGYINKIIIKNSEKIQDGIIRLNYVAWKAADAYEKSLEEKKELILPQIESMYSRMGLDKFSSIFSKVTKEFDSSAERMGGYIESIVDKIDEVQKRNGGRIKHVKEIMEKATSKIEDGLMVDALLQKVDTEVGKILEKMHKEEARESVKDIPFRNLDTGMRALVMKVEGNERQLQTMSEELSGEDTVIFLISEEGNVFASSGEKASQYYGVGSIAKEMFDEFEGKGGGSPHLARGKVPEDSIIKCITWLDERIK